MSYGQPFIVELRAQVERLKKELAGVHGELAEKVEEITGLKKAAKKTTTKKTAPKKTYTGSKKPEFDKFGQPKESISIEELTKPFNDSEELDK